MSTTNTTHDYDEIRPFDDSEVKNVLRRVINEGEFIETMVRFKFGKVPLFFQPWSKFLVSLYIRRKFSRVKTIRDFQLLVKPMVDDVIQKTTAGFTVSGLDNIDPERSYLFMSNHRDIAMDSAFLNYALVMNGMETLRIAIGDNLLTKPFASDLMRLNKSFIVNRSNKAPRQILKASKLLAAYMRDSITLDKSCVWIAQREGRAKDGADITEPAIIKMLALSKQTKTEALSETLGRLNIVPVAISYEYDPCDAAKAKELAIKASGEHYEKTEQEDVHSIGMGISGDKGRVHIAIGTPLGGNFETANDVAQLVDMQVMDLYHLHPSNFFAYESLYGANDALSKMAEAQGWLMPAMNSQRALFEARVGSLPETHQPYMLKAYAECVKRKLALGFIE